MVGGGGVGAPLPAAAAVPRRPAEAVEGEAAAASAAPLPPPPHLGSPPASPAQRRRRGRAARRARPDGAARRAHRARAARRRSNFRPRPAGPAAARRGWRRRRPGRPAGRPLPQPPRPLPRPTARSVGWTWGVTGHRRRVAVVTAASPRRALSRPPQGTGAGAARLSNRATTRDKKKTKKTRVANAWRWAARRGAPRAAGGGWVCGRPRRRGGRAATAWVGWPPPVACAAVGPWRVGGVGGGVEPQRIPPRHGRRGGESCRPRRPAGGAAPRGGRPPHWHAAAAPGGGGRRGHSDGRRYPSRNPRGQGKGHRRGGRQRATAVAAAARGRDEAAGTNRQVSVHPLSFPFQR